MRGFLVVVQFEIHTGIGVTIAGTLSQRHDFAKLLHNISYWSSVGLCPGPVESPRAITMLPRFLLLPSAAYRNPIRA